MAIHMAHARRTDRNDLTGRNSAGTTRLPVLILPVFLVMWGLVVVTIAAFVR